MTGPLLRWRRPLSQPAPVLASVQAKPFGRPAAGLDPGCGRRRGKLGAGEEKLHRDKIRLTEVSTVLGDCQSNVHATEGDHLSPQPVPQKSRQGE